jgi:hypothetical protein
LYLQSANAVLEKLKKTIAAIRVRCMALTSGITSVHQQDSTPS